MFVNCCHIIIENAPGKKALDFFKVNEVEVKSSNKTFTDTCIIKLPRKLKILNGDINQVIKRGAKVTVRLGYDFKLVEEFTGYVARVNAEIPFTIECEDEMWQLKQQTFTKSFGRVKVKDVISHIWKGKSKVVDLTIGGLVVKEWSGAKVLEELKKYGLRAYFRSGVLIVDFAGSQQAGKRIYYNFQRNIIDPQLEYSRQDDLRIRIKGVSKFRNGKVVEALVGDKGGDLRTLHYVELEKSDLEKVIKQELERLKYDGYKGSFKTFGLPVIKPGDTAVLDDPEYLERKGSYQVEEVITTFNMDGYRRTISPERRIA